MNRNVKHNTARWYFRRALRWGWQSLHAAIALAGWLGMTIGMMVMGP